MPTELLQPGEQVKVFDADAAAAPVNSAAFALPTTYAKVVTWTYKFASAPSAATIKLQVSNDVNGPWTDLDTGSVTAGETKTTAVTDAAFIRGRKDAQTGGGALTLILTFGY